MSLGAIRRGLRNPFRNVLATVLVTSLLATAIPVGAAPQVAVIEVKGMVCPA